MTLLQRQSFVGWMPDADAINAPKTALLRADNTTLDEQGVLALRAGSALISALGGDAHSLFTVVRAGTKYRLVGDSNAVFANGSSIASGLAGSGDIAFGSHLGQILFARSTSKKKYDGTTVRNWGITQTGTAPTVAEIASDSKTLASFDSGEATLSIEEDDGTGLTYTTSQAGVANGSTRLHTNATTNRATVTRTLAAETDYTVYDAAGIGSDKDIVELYVWVEDPANLLAIDLSIDVNGSATNPFQTDYFFHAFKPEDTQTIGLHDVLDGNYTAQGTVRNRVRGSAPAIGVAVSRVRSDKPVSNSGWTKLQVRRGDMLRVGNTSGKDWKTVKAIRITVTTTTLTEVRLDALRLVQAPLFGDYKWAYVYVYNTGTYTAKSAPSALSAETHLQSAGATVTAPADASRDSQVNEIWLYRMGENLDAFYRVQVSTGVSGTGSVAIADTLSDVDALILNIRLESDNVPPPDTILDIEGPYYDRTFALTASGLYPSRRLNPDSFASGQVITVAGADETALWVRKALGGLYIGTTKDVYNLDGDGAEYPDGTINFTLRALNIDHPPISEAVAQEGNLLVYLADDGWRAMAGAGTQLLVGPTSLLYRGQARHGISAINVLTGRFRAAIAKGQLVAITPEGASTTSSTIVYRFVFANQRWYRHVYTHAWRAILREPDGTLVASDASGNTVQLDTGTQDEGADIAGLTIWTPVDDNDQPWNRKDPGDLRVRADTGNAAASVALHLDGSGTVATNGTKTVTQNGVGLSVFDLATVTVFRQVQLRITGTFATFRLYSYQLGYRERPIPFIGRTAETDAGYSGQKVLTGFSVKLNTLGATVTLTPYLDGVALAQTFAITTDSTEPETHVLQFTSAQTATDISWSVDGDVELYPTWEPLVLYKLPLLVKVWENKPLVPSTVRRRFGGFTLQLNTYGATATVTPVRDGVDQTPLTIVTADLLGATLTINAIVGRDLWCRITCPTNITVLDVQPIITETLPPSYKGQTPRSRFGYPGIKTVSALQIQLCTFAEIVTVSAVADGVVVGTADTQSGHDDPIDLTLQFDAAVEAVDWAISVDGDVELYSWQPIVTAKRPLGLKVWDSGPMDTGVQDLVWLREVRIKVRASADITVTPYFDGVAFEAVTLIAQGGDTVLSVPVGREYKGRTPRVVLTSSEPFFPYWLDLIRRPTSVVQAKSVIRIPANVGAQVPA